MLKIWNLNECGGVVGAFNCQGGGWCPEKRRNKCCSEYSGRVYSTVSPKDVEWRQGHSIKPFFVNVSESVDCEFAVYLYVARRLVVVKSTDEIQISLDPFNFELFTIAPVTNLCGAVKFAAVGLVNMLNTGGAVAHIEYGVDLADHNNNNSASNSNNDNNVAKVNVRGGQLCGYSSQSPKRCRLNGKGIDFVYDNENGMITIQVPWIGGPRSNVEYIF